MERKLKRKLIPCKHYGDVIESKTIHDFQRGTCNSVGIDGVLDYPKRIFISNIKVDYDELSEYE